MGAKAETDGKPRYDDPAKRKVLVDLDQTPSETERRVLLAMHGEVVASWRDLHDVRFKLLGLLPLVTVGVLSLDPGKVVSLPGAALGLVATLLGLLVSIGLAIYDRRNSQLYNDLISRGRRIEAELGLGSGVFMARPRQWNRFISHGTATRLIYRSVMLAWAAALVIAALTLIAVAGAG